MSRRKTHEEFVNEMKEVNPDIEILGKYLGANKKILCRCKIDGYVWEATPSNLLCGSGCPKCSGKINKTHEEFMTEFKEKNKNSCTIEILSRYKNNKSKMKCRCKVCNNIWNTNPQSLLYGSNCPKCSYKENGRKCRKTHEDFVDEMKTVNPNIKIISKYRSNKEKLSCECMVCGNIWDVKPNIYLPDRLWRASLTEAANPIFIWKALIQFDAKQQIRSLASGTSGTMKNISKPKLLSITIPKTSREKQDSFAQRLRAIQRQRNCIEESKKVAAVLFASRMDQYFNA